MTIQFIPALHFKDECRTVVAVAEPPESIGLHQGRDYVVLNEAEARRLYTWLGQCLQINGTPRHE